MERYMKRNGFDYPELGKIYVVKTDKCIKRYLVTSKASMCVSYGSGLTMMYELMDCESRLYKDVVFDSEKGRIEDEKVLSFGEWKDSAKTRSVDSLSRLLSRENYHRYPRASYGFSTPYASLVEYQEN